jgi:DNA mismatch endonuclease (patch repair protein)
MGNPRNSWGRYSVKVAFVNDVDRLKRSWVMSRIRSTETKPEKALRKDLWRLGYRYRKNSRNVTGRPDICFMRLKIAVFCDSEFWHGKYFLENRRIPKTNTAFWVTKFERNIARDKEVNKILSNGGWEVLRFWNEDIKRNRESIVRFVIGEIEKRRKLP